MSAPAGDNAPKRALRPRDAATLVIVDDEGDEPRILMGRRRPDQVFMPNKFVFPGGRVDAGDRSAPSADELPREQAACLLYDMKGRPSVSRARALALAAVRETFEETGLLIGTTTASTALPPAPACWQPFVSHGLLPRLSGMTLFARAITPPGRTRRYDTRFFHVSARQIARRLPVLDGELSAIDWFTLGQARALDLPSITRAVLEDLADRLASQPSAASPLGVPYYYFHAGTFRRALIPADGTAAGLDTSTCASMVPPSHRD
jgi:8-oxo-dGTP pyrophosphatase MutT (NUDIX family)